MLKRKKTLTDTELHSDNLASEPVFVMTTLPPHTSCLLSLKQGINVLILKIGKLTPR